jgi:hypothetical protein
MMRGGEEVPSTPLLHTMSDTYILNDVIAELREAAQAI